MEISVPGAQPLTPKDLQELDRLQTLIEKALADGIVTRDEVERIKATIYQKGTHRTAERLMREITLYRTLVTEKVQSGEIEIESLGGWNGPIAVN